MTADSFALADAILEKERELDALRRELALHRACSRVLAADTVIVRCRLRGHTIALLASEISEVVRMAELTTVPGAAPWFVGLLAVGAQRLPVLDLFARKSGVRRVPDPSEFIVLSETRNGPCGLVVDSIDDLVTIHGREVRRPTADAPFGAHVLGSIDVRGDTILLLSAAPLSLPDLGVAAGDEVAK